MSMGSLKLTHYQTFVSIASACNGVQRDHAVACH
jgi:hypothetical protein